MMNNTLRLGSRHFAWRRTRSLTTTANLLDLPHRGHSSIRHSSSLPFLLLSSSWKIAPNPSQRHAVRSNTTKRYSSSLISRDETVDLSDLLSPKKEEGVEVPTATTTTATAQLILDCQNNLGEGVVYDETTSSLLWSDILGQRFHSLDLNFDQPQQSRHCAYDLPKKLGSFGLLQQQQQQQRQGGRPLLCAWEDGFQLFDIEQNQDLSECSRGPDVNPNKGATRLNDGRTDVRGQRYVCGGCNGGDVGQKLSVFAVQQDEETLQLHHQEIVSDVEVTNSLCFLDETTMYLADSPQKQIWSYDYNPDAQVPFNEILSNKTVVHAKDEYMKFGVPDGSCVDAEGYLWNAVWRTDSKERGVVQRIDPATGRVVFTVDLPDKISQVSCCCFGGPNYDILFMTTAAEALDRKATEQPHAGGVYAVRLPFRGRPESRLNFKY